MRYFLGFLAAIGLIILVILLIIRGLGGGSSERSTSLPDKPLTSYADTATVVRMTVDGRVTDNDRHHAIRITVGRDMNTLEIIEGYEGEVVKSQDYPSNEAAYMVFLKAIEMQGFAKGNPDPKLADERGYCPLNSRYIYEIIGPGDDRIQRFWSSECKTGTFTGNGANIRTLFRSQIPDYSKAIFGYRL